MSLFLLALVFGASSLQAELEPRLNAGDTEAASFDFTSVELTRPWQAQKGEWRTQEGALVGKELAADGHAAVMTLIQPHTDASIRFRFKLDGAKGFHLSYNHTKGHLFRVRFDGKGVVLLMDKDKRDPESKQVHLDRRSEPAAAIAPGVWHTFLCETKGKNARVEIDGAIMLEGTHPDLAKEKTGFRFIVQGQSLRVEDVVTWVAK